MNENAFINLASLAYILHKIIVKDIRKEIVASNLYPPPKNIILLNWNCNVTYFIFKTFKIFNYAILITFLFISY